MSSLLIRLLLRLYPARWRDRYGSEFSELLHSEPTNLRTVVNVATSALRERIAPTLGVEMKPEKLSFAILVKQPTAFLPIVMSVMALSVLLLTLSLFGIQGARQPDEGVAAHLWQILVAGQLPLLFFFVLRWLPRAPRLALYILAVQALAVLAAAAPVFLLHL